MIEPKRIGLTPLVAQQLDELLIELNPDPDSKNETVKLVKFDIYRLAVALGIKENKSPPALNDKSNTVFRVNELDPDKTLFTVVECLDYCPNETSIYGYIEQLAEQGIKEFYEHLQQRGELPLADYLLDKD
ncbi:hypothetical protein MK852_00780 [Shewanella benthica]|nr:hypothetical protein [Shewanella benthica]